MKLRTRSRIARSALVTVLVATTARLCPAADPARPADLVLQNGNVVTVDKEKPRAEALAIRGDRIVAVGENREIKPYVGEQTTVIDLKGRLAIPGFIEGHGHFVSLGHAKLGLDLTRAKNWDEVVALVAAEARGTQPGEWIVGRGWHQEKWTRPPQPNVDGYPTHDLLSQASPDNPVLLTHASGHMCVANAQAMQVARIDNKTPDPTGGTILRDAAGEPIGVFRESAQAGVRNAYAKHLANRTPAQARADTLRAIEQATRECLSKGVTSFQDAGSSFETVDLFKKLADEKRLELRLWVMMRESNDRLRNKLAEYRTVGYGGHRLTVRAIKRMVDGALGSHGAWLLEPYSDLPDSRGLNVEPLPMIQETAVLAIEHEYQLCVHAIGDRANREVLDLYRTVMRSFPKQKDLRWRIEHAQHLHPDDIGRFAELGVIASIQANHCTSDAKFVIDRLGRERSEVGAYAWRSLLDSGAVVTNGTDAPVEDVNPILSFYASVTRRWGDGQVFFPAQCMTRAESLKSYTLDAAYAAFEEDLKGSLTPGKLADVVVLSRDILSCPEEDIPQTEVVRTIVGGKTVYEK